MQNRNGIRVLDPEEKAKRGIEKAKGRHREYGLYHTFRRLRERYGLICDRKLNRVLKKQRPMFVIGSSKYYNYRGCAIVYDSYLKGAVTALPKKRIIELFYREVCGWR